MNKQYKNESFIRKANEIHENKYDYSLINYQHSKLKIKIVCSKHGIFSQRPNDHLNRRGCPKCAHNKKSCTNSFIKKATKIHKNKYDYSKVKYSNNITKIQIICKACNYSFKQKPNDHLNGKGCPSCARKNISTKNFKSEAKTKHGNRYDYSLSEYKNTSVKIKIICPIHGLFKQLPNDHLCGKGCPKCANNVKMTLKEFIQKSNKIHNKKYDYSLSEYVNNKTKIKIICPIHGLFEQTPYMHLRSNGCKKCSSPSKKQKQLLNCLKFNLKYHLLEEQEIKIKNGKTYIADIFIPQKNIIIEYNGDYWHCNPKKYSSDYYHPHKKTYAKNIWDYDNKRKKLLEKMGYKVHIIWEHDFVNDKENVIMDILNEIKNF